MNAVSARNNIDERDGGEEVLRWICDQNFAALKDDDYSKATEQMEKHARERDRKIRAANKTN